jgi:PBS lyase HEAT-like repeat
MQSMSSDQLMAICDTFWAPGSGDYAEFVPAYNELATRGPEIRDWCRHLLTHGDYWARESGAFLLGQLGSRGLLGDAVEAVVAELGALTRRPMEEDGKESQAVDAAIMALAEIGHPTGIPHLRAVLLSNDTSLGGDTRWCAAVELGKMVGQRFMESPDPVNTALEWLSSRPDLGAGPA